MVIRAKNQNENLIFFVYYGMKTSIRENKRRAREHFRITGKTNLVLHHKDPELRHKDRERYNE